MSKGLIPLFDPHSARAIEETAKASRAVVEALDKAGTYAGGVSGRVPHNIVGIVDDWLLHKRLRRWDSLQRETAQILEARRVEAPEDPSPSIAVPLLEAALDEDREVLKQIWAKLLASSVDPSRRGLVRKSVIDAVRQMDPLDALVLHGIGENPSASWAPNGRDFFKVKLSSTEYEILVSFGTLERLQCIAFTQRPNINPILDSLGRLILQAVLP